MDDFSGAVVRLHGPFSLRIWDNVTVALGVAFLLLAYPLIEDNQPLGAHVTAFGGLLLVLYAFGQRQRHREQVWTLASESDDPIETLVLYEYLYEVRFRDLAVLAHWRTLREAAGLPVICEPDDEMPAQVRHLIAHLRSVQRES